MTRNRSNSWLHQSRNSLSARGSGQIHMRIICICVALCALALAIVLFGGGSSLMAKQSVISPVVPVVSEVVGEDDVESWKALGMGSKEFEEGEEVSAFDHDVEEVSILRNSTSLANETMDFSTFTSLTVSSNEFSETFSGCIHIQQYICPAAGWACSECSFSILLGGVNPHLQVRLVPASKKSTENLFAFQSCKEEGKFISAEGGVRLKAVAKNNSQKFKIGFSKTLVNGFGFYIVTNEKVPKYIVDRGGRVTISGDPSKSENKGTWSLLPVLPDWVHFLSGVPKYTSVKKHDGATCIKRYRGCCFPRRFLPELRKPSPKEAKPIIAPLITSSKATLPGRIDILERWLFNGDLKPVITTDCYMPTMLERFKKHPPAAWLIGPTGPSVRGHAEVVMRVSLAVHWVVHNLELEWFFVCDDDTLVFPHNLLWVASHFPDPKEVPYYIGHTTEWHRKTRYHGDMAFGGGGVLISAGMQKAWASKWNNMPKDAIHWLDSGNWNHAGGDGAVCRLIVWLMKDTKGADFRYFAETRGFHQFDLIGKDYILKDVGRTCPKCPPIFDQIGHWMDSAISEHPVITLHHLGGIRHGALFPNLNGPQSMAKLYDGYYSAHHHLFLRRLCSSADGNGKNFTFCINFGRSVQMYSSVVSPKDTMNILLYTDFKGKPQPEKLINLRIPSGPEKAHYDTVYFENSDSENNQIYKPSDLVPAPTPVRKNNTMFVTKVSVGFIDSSAKLTFTFPDDRKVDANIDISHLLKPEVSLSDGGEFIPPADGKPTKKSKKR